MSYFHFEKKDLQETLSRIISKDHKHLVGFLSDVLTYHNCDEAFLKAFLGMVEKTEYVGGMLVDINTSYVTDESAPFSTSNTGTVRAKILKVLPFSYRCPYVVEFIGKSGEKSHKVIGRIPEHGIVVPSMDLLE